VITDEVSQALFDIEGLLHATDVARAILDPDEHCPARGIGECDETPEHSVRRRHVALEFEGLPLRSFEQVEQVHELGSIL
jgi:hypothetical protein